MPAGKKAAHHILRNVKTKGQSSTLCATICDILYFCFMCVFIFYCGGGGSRFTHVEGREQLQESVLSLCRVGPENGTQVVKPSSRCLHPPCWPLDLASICVCSLYTSVSVHTRVSSEGFCRKWQPRNASGRGARRLEPRDHCSTLYPLYF